MRRYEFLDSLRGIAILGVVMTHVGQAVPDAPEALASFARFGLRGVQLFFMVSALTLCMVTKPETVNPARFYIRRYFRIAPMFYVAALFYLSSPTIFGVDYAGNVVRPIDVASTLLFVHGFNPHGINNVVPGGWSIASEAIFYAMFRFVVAHAHGPRRWLVLTIVTILLAVANSAMPAVLGLKDPDWRNFFHFNFLNNLPAFATGILLFTILRARSEAPLPRNMLVPAVMAIVVACAVIGCLSSSMQGDQILMIPVLGCLTFVAMVSAPRLFVNKGLSFLGEISFSIYLVHFAVLHALGDLVWTGMAPTMRLAGLYGRTITISGVVAFVTYQVIERPMTRIGHRLSGLIPDRRYTAPASP